MAEPARTEPDDPDAAPRAASGGGRANGDAPTLPSAFASLVAEAHRLIRLPRQRLRIVIDGSGFENAPERLRQAGVWHRALYRGPDSALIAAGPHLVDLYRDLPEPAASNTDAAAEDDEDLSDAALAARSQQFAEEMKQALEDGDETGGGVVPEAAPEPHLPPEGPEADAALAAAVARLDRLANVLGPTPFAIFWLGGPAFTDAALYRHLRSLNKVLIPKDGEVFDTAVSDGSAYIDGPPHKAADGETGSDTPLPSTASAADGPDAGHDTGQEAVLFRHGDGNVLAQVLPALTPDHLSRLFGPADVVFFAAPDYPGPSGRLLNRAARTPNLPPATPGMLALTAAEVAAIEGLRKARSADRIADYLTRCAPKQAGEHHKTDLRRFAAESVDDSNRIGLVSEAAHGRWAYLRLMTGGQISRNEDVVAYLKHPDGKSPDEKVSLLLKSVTLGAKQMQGKP